MENDKTTEFEESLGVEEDDFASDTSSRARNRTVMLTPEITGEVRARLAKDLDPGGTRPSDAFESPSSEGGFEAPGASSYAPAASSPPPPPSGSVMSGGHAADPAPRRAASGVSAALPRSSGEGVVWMKESPIVGFLVSFDSNPNGSVFELRSGRLIVTSDPPGTGNYLVVPDDSVSPMHAIMRVSTEGDIQVLDQLSEFGTRIVRFGSSDEEELSGDKSSIEHGDKIYFGERCFNVCLVAREEEA